MIPIYVLTNRKHHWLLHGFAYLFNQFWGDNQKVTVVSYGKNDLKLPANFGFHSIAAENYPVEKWSDGLIRFLHQINDDMFITLLEDFWLNAPVDVGKVTNLYRWMQKTKGTKIEVLRLELWRSVRSKKKAMDWGQIRGVPIVTAGPGAKYQMNLQCNIWNTFELYKVLKPGETPWQVEIEGTKRVSEIGFNVLGVANPLVNYEPIFQKGSIDHARLQMIPKVHLDRIKREGWLRR